MDTLIQRNKNIFNSITKRLVVSLIIILLILGFGVFYLFYLIDYIKIPCYFHLITGLDCPGCGITRALISIVNFEFVEALQYNKLVYLIILILGYYICVFFYQFIFNKKVKQVPNYILVILLIVFLIYGVIRNIY